MFRRGLGQEVLYQLIFQKSGKFLVEVSGICKQGELYLFNGDGFGLEPLSLAIGSFARSSDLHLRFV